MVISNLISSSLSLLFSPCLPVSCLAANRLPHGPSLLVGWLLLELNQIKILAGEQRASGERSWRPFTDTSLLKRCASGDGGSLSEWLLLMVPFPWLQFLWAWRQYSVPLGALGRAKKCSPLCWTLGTSTTLVVSVYPGRISESGSFS